MFLVGTVNVCTSAGSTLASSLLPPEQNRVLQDLQPPTRRLSTPQVRIQRVLGDAGMEARTLGWWWRVGVAAFRFAEGFL